MLTTSTPICKLWPNGEFTVGLSASKRMQPHFVEKVDDSWGRACLAIADAYGVREELLRSTQRAAPLGSSNPPNSPKRGRNGITSYGRRMVRNACYWMEQRYGIRRMGFGTLTLPALGDRDYEEVIKNWSAIVKGFFKDLGRLLQRRELPDDYVCVTEIQEKRYDKDKWLPLHLHFVYVGRRPCKCGWQIRPVEVRDIWSKNVQKYCVQSYDFSSSENLQAIRKSASSYLGKYMSKGGKVLQDAIHRLPPECIPTAWYSIRRSVGRAVKRTVRHLPNIGRALCRATIDRRLTRHLSWITPVTFKDKDGCEKICGFVGQFKRTFSNKELVDSLELLLANT